MAISLDRVGNARAVLIAGPTASGKSAVALALAEESARYGREAWVVNADSKQVYDALRVLTARPTSADEARAPHRLYGHVAADVRYSAGAWLRDMERVLREAKGAGALVIATGGTGLYFKALTEGLAAVPPVPPEIRRRLVERLAAEGPGTLHEELGERDPGAAHAIPPGDPHRILRALEVVEATGRSILDWQKMRAEPPLLSPHELVRFVLEPPRPTLYARIDRRFDGMVEAGALDEINALLARNLDPTLPVMKAHGVQAFASYLRGARTLEEAIEYAKTETRNYAKRQTTWFRHQMRDWPRI